MILGRSRYDSATASLRDLHWLPVKYRINFKIVTLVFKCLNNQAPAYLQKLLHIRTVRPGLRSAYNGIFLNVPKTSRHTFLARSFAVSGPTLWNKLPQSIRECDSLTKFKSALKTYYFDCCF